MDILVSSNLERLLFALSGEDDKQTASYMRELSEAGRYTVTPQIHRAIGALFWADSCDDEKTKRVIEATYQKYGYLLDTHTAVAFDVLNHYRHDTGDKTPTVVVSTASPYKFADSVLEALGQDGHVPALELIDKLSAATRTQPPQPLLNLRGKRRRFSGVVETKDLPPVVKAFLR